MQAHALTIPDEIYDEAMHRGIPLSTQYFFNSSGVRMYLAYNGREAFGFDTVNGRYVYDHLATHRIFDNCSDRDVRDVSCDL